MANKDKVGNWWIRTEKNKEVINNKMPIFMVENHVDKSLSNRIMGGGAQTHKIRNDTREIINKIEHIKKIIRSYFLQYCGNKCEDLDEKNIL